MRKRNDIVCKYVRHSEKAYNVLVSDKWHSTHYTLDAAIKEAVRMKKKNPNKSVTVIKQMGYVECLPRERWEYF